MTKAQTPIKERETIVSPGEEGSAQKPTEIDAQTLAYLTPVEIIRFDYVEAKGKWGTYKTTTTTFYSVAAKKYYSVNCGKDLTALFRANLEISPHIRTFTTNRGADNKLIWSKVVV